MSFDTYQTEAANITSEKKKKKKKSWRCLKNKQFRIHYSILPYCICCCHCFYLLWFCSKSWSFFYNGCADDLQWIYLNNNNDSMEIKQRTSFEYSSIPWRQRQITNHSNVQFALLFQCSTKIIIFTQTNTSAKTTKKHKYQSKKKKLTNK